MPNSFDAALSSVVPEESIPSLVEATAIQNDLIAARRFLIDSGHSVRRLFYGAGIPGVVCVALAEVDSGSHYLWVIGGDVPGNTLPIAVASNPVEALSKYCASAEGWMAAVEAGNVQAAKAFFPHGLPFSGKLSRLLRPRVESLRLQIVPELASRKDWGRLTTN